MDTIKQAIKVKIIELAKNLGHDASLLGDEDVIPDTGYLDSGAIIELIVWLEEHFLITISDTEITLDNLGSLAAMEQFVERKRLAHAPPV